MSSVKRAVAASALVVGLLALGVVATFVYYPGSRKFVMDNTSSMSPTINNGELVFAEPFRQQTEQLRRHDIVVFECPDSVLSSGRWVMRVVGLPGERVEVRTNSLVINGVKLSAKELPAALRIGPWLTAQVTQANPQPQWTLGPDQVFVVGDNLGAALDSRFWGPLSVTNIIAMVESKAKGRVRQVKLGPILLVRYVGQQGPRIPLSKGEVRKRKVTN